MDEDPDPGGAYSEDLTIECGQDLVGRVPRYMEAGGWAELIHLGRGWG